MFLHPHGFLMPVKQASSETGSNYLGQRGDRPKGMNIGMITYLLEVVVFVDRDESSSRKERKDEENSNSTDWATVIYYRISEMARQANMRELSLSMKKTLNTSVTQCHQRRLVGQESSGNDGYNYRISISLRQTLEPRQQWVEWTRQTITSNWPWRT